MTFMMRAFEHRTGKHGPERTKPTRLTIPGSAAYELSGGNGLAQVALRVLRDVDQQPEDGGRQTFPPDESTRVQPRNVDVPQTLLSRRKPPVQFVEHGGKLSTRLT